MMKSKSIILILSLFPGLVLFTQCVKNRNTDSGKESIRKESTKVDNTKYGAWGGPGVAAKAGPMDTILLKDYNPASSVVTQETFIPKAKYPVIDVHAHVLGKTPEEVSDWVKTMDEVGIEKSVVLSGATGAEFDKLVDLYLKPYPTRFILFCGLEKTNIEKPDYSERAVNELVRCYKMGAGGVGELSDKGMGFTREELASDKRLHPDDSRMDAFWEKCAELNLPVNIHIADHPSCWKPLDVYQERSPDYQHFNMYGKDVPSHEELISTLDRTLQKHSKTTFIACHFSNLGHDLAQLSTLLDKHSNLFLDISARDYEIGRTPRAASKFLEKYSTRCLFGTDMGRVKSMYQAWWRLLESEDEYMIGRNWWRYYGLGLPDKVLKSLYKDNADRIISRGKV